MPRCIITGCALVDIARDAWVWGDLHEEGDCYVFNACLDNGETDWRYTDAPSASREVQLYGVPFERRGVIVFAKSRGQLNAAAQAHIDTAPPED